MQKVQDIPRPPKVLQDPANCCQTFLAIINCHHNVALLLNLCMDGQISGNKKRVLVREGLSATTAVTMELPVPQGPGGSLLFKPHFQAWGPCPYVPMHCTTLHTV
jgi:hypothetical protein